MLLLGPDLSAVSGVSTHLAMLVDSPLSQQAQLHHFQVGSEGRQESKPGALLRLLISPWQLSRRLARDGIGIVHINTSLDPKAFWRDCAYTAVARARRRRVVYQVHGGDLPEAFIAAGAARGHALRTVLRTVDLVVLLAEVERRAYRDLMPALPLRVVPNAIPRMPRPTHAPTEHRDLRLVYVGRLLSTKGLLEAVDAVALLRDRGVDVEFTIAGSGRDEAALRARIAERLVEDRVNMVGPVFGAAKAQLWHDSDVFVFATYREGLPYALLEAMSAGTVPVTCAVGAIPDVVTDGVHGLLVEPRSAAAIADRVGWLATHRTELTRMGQAAARRVDEAYTVERLAADFADIYRGLAAGRPSAPQSA